MLLFHLRKRLCHRGVCRFFLALLRAGGAVVVAGGFAFAAGFVGKAHGEGDAFARGIDFQHFDFDDVAGFDDVARILYEAVGKGGDVDEAVLVDADIDKCAEVGDVGDDAFEDHARL